METALTTPEPAKIDPNAIWKVYKATVESGKIDDILSVVKMTTDEFDHALATCEPFRNAYEAAKAKSSLGLIAEFVDQETLETWEILERASKVSEKQQALMNLATRGDVARQRLFVHAVVESQFNIAKVCKTLGIGKKTLDTWLRESKEFREMLENIQWAKKAFVESHFMDLIAKGSEKATIAAAQTLLRDEYGQSVRVEGQINHAVAVVDLGAIKLPVEARRAILEAVQEAGLTDLDGLFVGETLEG